MNNNNCDGSGPCDMGEVRVLPTGGDSNAILCRACFDHEIRFRRERNRDLAESCKFALPSWDSLKVYRVAEGNENTLYGEIVAAGVPFASHETDLYIKDTEAARAILDRYPTSKINATRFQSQVEGGTWIDVPFAYLPAWEAKQRKATYPNFTDDITGHGCPPLSQMNIETKHTPDELITCPACGNEYQYQDSPQCFESAEAAAKELAQLKADKAELIQGLAKMLLPGEHLDIQQGMTIERLFPVRYKEARALIAKHSK